MRRAISLPDLYPLPFATLVGRLARELERGESVYLLPRREWWTPDPDRDLGLSHLGRRLGTPAGPASGPHTQLAQNLVLAWLAGGRFMELKTVQVDDELVIPRPCIHVPHLGFNVEWSQELRVGQSALEYVKGWMLVHMLAGPRGPGLWPGVQATWDLSLGYDLAGIETDKIGAYVAQLRDAGSLIEALRDELPAALRPWAELPIPSQVCDSVTLSTFHGCPAQEIEAIATRTLDWGLHTVIKLNPTLLGHETVRGLLDHMGYPEIALRLADFDRDLQWAQLHDMLPRLRAHAAARGLGFGIKLTNTLVHHSAESGFPQPDVYLSGPPLHVLATVLADRVRDEVGPELPITFSAGVDANNLADVVASGIAPVTTCTDLLKGRGYARMAKALRRLEERMAKVGAADLDAFRCAVGGDPQPLVAGRQALAARAATVADQVAYRRSANDRAPRKVGSELELLDCLSCDKCLPVCPNAANFTLPMPPGSWPGGMVRWDDGPPQVSPGPPLVVEKKHQIGNTADLCNLCGQCDVWCPEDGGPHLVKPNLFLSERAFADHPERAGFLLDLDHQGITWRRGARLLRYRRQPDGSASVQVDAGRLSLVQGQPVAAEGQGAVDLAEVATLRLFLDAFTDPMAETWLGAPR